MRFLKENWFKWLLIGLALRLVLMPITAHPDLWGHSFTAYFFTNFKVLNPYEHLMSLSSDHPLVVNFGVSDIFIYPPLTYFTLGIFRFLVSPLLDSQFVPWLMENVGEYYLYHGVHWQVFWFKFPYLIVDFLAAFYFCRLFDNKKSREQAFILWMINPLTIYSTFMMGQIDILPTFFVIIALFFAKRKKYAESLLALGVGGSYKMFPLLLVPLFAFLFGKSFWERCKYLFYGFLPFAAFSIPYVGSRAFRQMVLFTPKSQKMLFMRFNVSGAEAVLPFVFLLFVIYFYSYYQARRNMLVPLSTTITLLIFSLTHYHPQWFLWATPFLFWVLVKENFRPWLLVATLFVCWTVLLFFFEPSLSWGLFGILDPSLLKTASLADILVKYVDVFQFKSIVRSVFAGASLYLSFSMIKNEKEKK